MHVFVLYPAIGVIAVLFAVCAVLILRARSAATRILMFDTLNLLLVALLSLIAVGTGSAYYLDAALLLALLSFTGTVAAARYYGERGLFS